MDFDQAIAAHGMWKKKLSKYIVKCDGSLKPGFVALDNQCVLGKWIHAESLDHLAPEYTALKVAHARFHKAAAEVVQRANSGQAVSAETVVGAGSDFTKASTAVVMAIVNIKKLKGR